MTAHARRDRIIGQHPTPLHAWALQEGDIYRGLKIEAIRRNALNGHVAVTTSDGHRTTYERGDALTIVRPKTTTSPTGWRRALSILAP